ncbi:MAG TPA: NAD(P)H-dependent glycerol-3-phosphate dehydrogenase [Ignavibacteria bacterium]|nr:NAD(P)H-dependent glycerol-3-phosphate dehydrogenase [Ignavibacteria bacterium]
MKIAVLGAGGWGTTLAILLNQNGLDVTLWEFNPEYAKTLKEYRENFYYLPKIKIPNTIAITNKLEAAVHGKNLIVIATPTQFIRSSLSELSNFDFKDSILVSVSKGIENKTHFLVSDILSDVFKKVKKKNLLCLSGPSHAEEVSKKIPTAVVCAGEDNSKTKIVQKIFSNDYFRVYRNDDLVGTEVGGALKNVIAIAAGISDGAGFGDNTKAAIMTRGINEIMRLGLKMKARKETFFGLSGIGDLIVTCASVHSRNRSVGEQIGKGKKLPVILKEMKMVAEGVATTKSAFELSKDLNIELPITHQVYNILFKDKDPHKATELLMKRNLKEEN